MKLKIVYKAIETIVPYKNNSRQHSDKQIEQIKASIKEFGMCNPIGLHNDTIVYGHARYEALKQLGYKEIPTVDLSHLSKTQMKAYVIADNKLALNASWDEELLKIEIEALQDEELDIDILGFSEDELDFIMGDVDLPDDEDFLTSEEKKTKEKICPHCGERL